MSTESSDWAALKKLDGLRASDLAPHRELITRVASQVGVTAGADLAATAAECRAVIKQGSARLMVAITAAQSAYASGNKDGAQAILAKALKDEPIAYYRAILSAELGRRS